ncbi:MAG TPA: ATP-binding protein [Vicinamibacterales bacterium]|nr:ATP-binding protein [Vicinamibacterales bacterium]
MTARPSTDDSTAVQQRHGSTPSLVLKQSSPIVASLSAHDPAIESGAVDTGIRILVVDDNHDLREYVARLLRRWWSIETVGDGLAALAAIQRQRPTLVLVAAAMPGLNGIGLPQTLRDDPATRSIPMIVVFDDGAETSDAYDCLTKPFSSRELVGHVSARLEEHSGSSVRTQRPVRRWLNKVDLPIAVLRSDGLIVENANRAYLELVGDRDVIGKPFGKPLGQPREEFPDAFASGTRHAARGRTLLLSRNGECEDTYWHFVLTPVKDRANGRDSHIVAIGIEVTGELRARRRSEALAAEAISANRAKDQFLAALGHELRNPLSPIVTGLQLMRTKGVRSHELDVVERQVGTIVRLVDDLLDVSRIGRGQIELQKERIEIAEVVTRAIETVDPLLKERQHRVTLLLSGPGLRVTVDPARMAQVIANLLTNAAKYSERGSEITVRTERYEQRVRISVEDRGIGIAAEMLPHVFEPFAQERSAVRRSRGGLGLGLAIVRNLVDIHGGKVIVRSDGLGSGSTFCVELPAA